MSGFVPFELEEFLSRYEHTVSWNYSESGVAPMRLGDLLTTGDAIPEIFDTELGYPEVNGAMALRERIAALYPGARAEQVLVTVGAAEANLLAVLALVEPGAEIVCMRPSYPQVEGIARNLGATVRALPLDPARGWTPDLDALERVVGPRTRLVALTNPNNPTGTVLGEDAMDAIVAITRRHDAWLLADEVYAGAERERETPTPSFWGRYERTVVVNGLSKAYGLPGLRIGWALAPEATIEALWRRHEYATISSTALGQRLALHALGPGVRERILARTRDLVRAGYAVLEEVLGAHRELFSWTPPAASAMVLVRYHAPIGSRTLVERLRREDSVLVAPGDAFGCPSHLRISFALPESVLRPGLARLVERVAAIAHPHPALQP